jgi:pyrrolidone-carboxylate peptidase
LSARAIGEYALTKLRLPVVFGEAARRAIFAAEESKCDAVLCIGQAGGAVPLLPGL